MSVLLLTFTVSTGFVSNTYQKAYAADDFPTSDLSPKIREWINNQIREDLFAPSSSISSIKITLSGFPHQTSESVTNVGLRCSPLTVARNVCVGADNIVIPGIGKVNASVFSIIYHFQGRQDGEHRILSAIIYGTITVGLLSIPILLAAAAAAFFEGGSFEHFDGTIINTIISGNGAVTRTIYIPGIGPGQATVQLS
jgi:hypothetical protein